MVHYYIVCNRVYTIIVYYYMLNNIRSFRDTFRITFINVYIHSTSLYSNTQKYHADGKSTFTFAIKTLEM